MCDVLDQVELAPGVVLQRHVVLRIHGFHLTLGLRVTEQGRNEKLGEPVKCLLIGVIGALKVVVGVREGGEVYKELEKLHCKAKGILKPSQGDPETSSTTLVETTPDPITSSEEKEGEDEDDDATGEEGTVDTGDILLSTQKFRRDFDEWNEEVMKALLAVRGANPSNYKSLKTELQNQYNLGQNNYPSTLSAATRILQNYVGTKGVAEGGGAAFEDDEVEEVSFLQSEKKPVKGTDGKLYINVPCHNCGDMGHYKSHCPKRDTGNEPEVEGSNLFQVTEDDGFEEPDSEDSDATHDVSFLQFFCLMNKVKGQSRGVGLS